MREGPPDHALASFSNREISNLQIKSICFICIQIPFVPQEDGDVNHRALQGLTSILQYAIVEDQIIFVDQQEVPWINSLSSSR